MYFFVRCKNHDAETHLDMGTMAADEIRLGFPSLAGKSANISDGVGGKRKASKVSRKAKEKAKRTTLLHMDPALWTAEGTAMGIVLHRGVEEPKEQPPRGVADVLFVHTPSSDDAVRRCVSQGGTAPMRVFDRGAELVLAPSRHSLDA